MNPTEVVLRLLRLLSALMVGSAAGTITVVLWFAVADEPDGPSHETTAMLVRCVLVFLWGVILSISSTVAIDKLGRKEP